MTGDTLESYVVTGAHGAHVRLSDQRERTKWTRVPYLVGGPAALGGSPQKLAASSFEQIAVE